MSCCSPITANTYMDRLRRNDAAAGMSPAPPPDVPPTAPDAPAPPAPNDPSVPAPEGV